MQIQESCKVDVTKHRQNELFIRSNGTDLMNSSYKI